MSGSSKSSSSIHLPQRKLAGELIAPMNISTDACVYLYNSTGKDTPVTIDVRSGVSDSIEGVDLEVRH